MKHQLIRGILIARDTPLNLNELSHATHLKRDIIIEMVEYRLLTPQGHSPETWQFDEICFKRAKTAASFYHDLEVNLSGVAVVLDLFDRIEQLESQLRILGGFEE